MEACKFTVIVPVHNSEKYLYECLKSLSMQTYSDFEALIIDDYSKDRTISIVKSFSEKDARFILMEDSNGSYGHKINLGFENAKGDYVCILESDDLYELDTLESFAAIIDVFHPDYVDGNYTEIKSVKQETDKKKVVKFDSSDLYEHLSIGDENLLVLDCFCSAIWSGAYNKQFVLQNMIKLNESEGASYQDLSFKFIVACCARKSYHLRNCLYKYRVDNNMSSSVDNSKIFAIQGEFEFLYNQLKLRNLINNNDIMRSFFIRKYNGSYLWNVYRLGISGAKKFCCELRKELLRDYGQIATLGICDCISNDVYNLYGDIDMKELSGRKTSGGGEAEENLFYDFINCNDFVIFGCGKWGQRFFSELNEEQKTNILAFSDNDSTKWNGFLYKRLVLNPSDAYKNFPKASYIVAVKTDAEDILQQLIENGIEKKKIYLLKQF